MAGPRDDGDELVREDEADAANPIDDLPRGEPGEPERPGRFTRFRRRILDRRDITDDARYLIGTVWETSDRAKSEVIKMFGREVRNYLEGMQLKDDIKELITSHSLEVRASFHLKPLYQDEEEEEEWDEEEVDDEAETSEEDESAEDEDEE